MLVALGADHAGFDLKESLKRILDARGVAWRDVGTSGTSPVDYPDYAVLVASAVADGHADRGILACGSGVGMAIAANKVAGIRAAQIADADQAALAREHNDINILTLGGHRLDPAALAGIVAAFLDTPFAAGRHAQRVEKLRRLDGTAHSTPVP